MVRTDFIPCAVPSVGALAQCWGTSGFVPTTPPPGAETDGACPPMSDTVAKLRDVKRQRVADVRDDGETKARSLDTTVGPEIAGELDFELARCRRSLLESRCIK